MSPTSGGSNHIDDKVDDEPLHDAPSSISTQDTPISQDAVHPATTSDSGSETASRASPTPSTSSHERKITKNPSSSFDSPPHSLSEVDISLARTAAQVLSSTSDTDSSTHPYPHPHQTSTPSNPNNTHSPNRTSVTSILPQIPLKLTSDKSTLSSRSSTYATDPPTIESVELVRRRTFSAASSSRPLLLNSESRLDDPDAIQVVGTPGTFGVGDEEEEATGRGWEKRLSKRRSKLDRTSVVLMVDARNKPGNVRELEGATAVECRSHEGPCVVNKPFAIMTRIGEVQLGRIHYANHTDALIILRVLGTSTLGVVILVLVYFILSTRGFNTGTAFNGGSEGPSSSSDQNGFARFVTQNYPAGVSLLFVSWAFSFHA
ncbi:hypothetical protein HK102_007663, partial [Quaeritorhiza haematococci]